jgi:type I restriction enzyme S subunit
VSIGRLAHQGIILQSDFLVDEDLLGIELRIPSDEKQQKIAGCLTSLDDLIAAQGRKIDLLKQHKRGLMQQIFPTLDEAG